MISHEIIAPRAELPVYFSIYRAVNQLVPSHWHSHLEVLYLFRGTMHIVRSGETYTLRQKDLFIVNSGDIHLTRSPGSIEVLLLQIPYEYLSPSIPEFDSVRFREHFAQSGLGADPVFSQMTGHLLRLREIYETGGAGYPFLFGSSLNLFLHLLYRHYSFRQDPAEKNKGAKTETRLRELLDYVQQNHAKPFRLREAASMAALNPEYFCRSFKKYTGFTFMEYLSLVRLAHIRSDLLETGDSILAILERHGFTNYKVFLRMFKEAYGCTPSGLRAGVSGEDG